MSVCFVLFMTTRYPPPPPKEKGAFKFVQIVNPCLNTYIFSNFQLYLFLVNMFFAFKDLEKGSIRTT
jgi:hypothetical protein